MTDTVYLDTYMILINYINIYQEIQLLFYACGRIINVKRTFRYADK